MVEISRYLQAKNEALEARGTIKPGMATAITYATILERGVRAFHEGFYGDAMQKAVSAAATEQKAVDLSDELVRDLLPMLNAYEQGGFMAAHTTSDFPLALANLRQRFIIGEYKGVEGGVPDWVSNRRTVSDFRPVRYLKFAQMPELRLRPEGTDVQYATFTESQDGYRVANYELAVNYTWEMWLADDLGLWDQQMRSLGRAAARTRRFIILQAVAAGLVRSVEAGILTGAPTIANVTAARQALTARTFTDSAGVTQEYGFDATDIIFGTASRDAVNATLNQEFSNFQGGAVNVLQGAFIPHLERMWSRVFGTDYVLFDNMADWVEVAFLAGFEGGARTYTKLPDVREHPSEGSFANHSLAVKVGDALGSKVTDPTSAIRIQGA